jgi:hypothetical protein
MRACILGSSLGEMPTQDVVYVLWSIHPQHLPHPKGSLACHLCQHIASQALSLTVIQQQIFMGYLAKTEIVLGG